VAPAFFYSGVWSPGRRNGYGNRRKAGLATAIPEIDRELEGRLEALGMELVEVEWAGSDRRPILRIRVDFPDSAPGRGVTVDDCARASRELEPWLDGHPLVPEKYTIEVSSPGVERPLHRRRDFVRFVGEEVLLKGSEPLEGGGSSRIQGELTGIEDGEGEEGYTVLVRRKNGDVVRVPRSDIVRAQLVFRWDG
jgi:ribosome maturation factor RimP